MSYIKIKMPDGREEGLKFNQMAILEIGERKSKNKYPENSIQSGIYAIASIVYAGLKGNAFAKDTEENFTWEECAEWADISTIQEKSDVVSAFTSSEKYKENSVYKADQKVEVNPKKKSALKNTKANASK